MNSSSSLQPMSWVLKLPSHSRWRSQSEECYCSRSHHGDLALSAQSSDFPLNEEFGFHSKCEENVVLESFTRRAIWSALHLKCLASMVWRWIVSGGQTKVEEKRLLGRSLWSSSMRYWCLIPVLQHGSSVYVTGFKTCFGIKPRGFTDGSPVMG